jgi:hypothetical protein
MKLLLTLFSFLLLTCGHNSPPTITEQQLRCLNKKRDYVQHSVDSAQQTFYRQEEDVYLFKTPDDRVIGYLFEQGECSTVMTQLPADGREQAEQYIAAEIKKNYGPMFITKDKQHFKYYTTEQGGETYLVAQAL